MLSERPFTEETEIAGGEDVDRCAWFKSDDGAQCSSREAEHERTSPLSITWLAVRAEYVHPRGDNQPVLNGVQCLLFGIGTHGAAWLDRLGRSAWFVGLEPQPDDLNNRENTRGQWVMPSSGGVADDGNFATEVEAFLANTQLPQAWCAAIAVPSQIGPADIAIVLGLVEAVRARRDPMGRHLSVVVTMEDAGPSTEVLTKYLCDRGAFVIHGSAEASGDHLHHYPLRAAIPPREGRVICVDFCDFLFTWRPGRNAVLHTISGDLEVKPGSPGCAINILFDFDWGGPGFSLEEIDRLSGELREQWVDIDGDVVFTTADRLDERTGWIDLLVIEEATMP